MGDDVDANCRLGVLAFGDSITNGGGELQWGVALQSWAFWTARALGMAYTSFATDGATVADVVGDQLPAAVSRSATPDGRYDVGCLHIGVNDVRALDWDAAAYGRGLRVALDFLAERCERTVLLTIPVDLGRPRAGAKVGEANAVLAAEAGRAGALVVDLRGFRGRGVLMPDHVHPTALGQVAIAERAVDALAADGLEVFVRPGELVHYETDWSGRLRGDATYAYRHAKVSLSAAWYLLGAR
jgi:lysophospholipase L1-like esterase